MIEYIRDVVVYLLFFFIMMLWHELMHIKGWGIKTNGKIEVYEYGYRCSSSIFKPDPIRWGYLNGGLLTAITCFILAVLIPNSLIRMVFLGNGTLQFIYGVYEWKHIPNIPWQRYSIYIIVSVIFILGYWLYEFI